VLQKDVAIQLKSHSKTRSIPILLMTGYTLRGSNGKVPADDTIEKPFNLFLLEKKIENLMNGVITN
jgi:CheY-like chemotaxis protein